jgi:hypothetical protein
MVKNSDPVSEREGTGKCMGGVGAACENIHYAYSDVQMLLVIWPFFNIYFLIHENRKN